MKSDGGRKKVSSRGSKSSFTWRKLAGKYRLFRLLKKDARFRYTVAVSVVTLLVLGISLPRIWIVSPKGFPVVYRARLVSLLAAPMERRRAEAASAAGNRSGALIIWERVLSDNPCDVKALRGLIREAAAQEQPERRWFLDSLDVTSRLYAVAQTNVDDVAAMARVYATYGHHDKAIAMLSQNISRLTAASACTLGVELIEGRQAGGFPELWSRYGSIMSSSPEGSLLHDAWEVGWGHGSAAAAAKQSLEIAAKEPKTALVALRLALAADENNVDLPSFRAHFKMLQELKRDRISDAVAHWCLLELCGKHQSALDLATSYANVPQSAAEAAALAEGWRLLKLYPRINEMARTKLGALREDPRAWIEVGNALLEGGLWDDVRVFAAGIREHYDLKSRLNGYANYLEGLAAHHQRERPNAIEYFQSAINSLPEDRLLAFAMAHGMRVAGYDPLADSALSSLVGEHGSLVTALLALLEQAGSAIKGETAAALAEEIVRADPSNRTGMARSAAALVATRQLPEQALRLLSAVATASPLDSHETLIYAAALVQNGQLEQAQEQLGLAFKGELNAADKAWSALVQLEIGIAVGHLDNLSGLLSQLDNRCLAPAQRDWLTTQMYRVRLKSKGAT